MTLVDIAPTILDLAGVERPASMEGRRFERSDDGPATGEERAELLAEIDAAAQYRDDMVAPVAVAFVVLQAVLWIGAAFALRRDDARGRRAVARRRAGDAGLPAGHVPRRPDRLPRRARLRVLGCSCSGWPSPRRSSPSSSDGEPSSTRCCSAWRWCSGSSWSTCSLGAPLQLNTVFGYSPTVGGRFAGMGNLAYGQFAGAAFLLCGLLSQRLAGWRSGTAVAFGVLILAVVIDGMPIWGSDVGGVLALVPAIGVTAAVCSAAACGGGLVAALGVARARGRGGCSPRSTSAARPTSARTWVDWSNQWLTRAWAPSSRSSPASSAPTSR